MCRSHHYCCCLVWAMRIDVLSCFEETIEGWKAAYNQPCSIWEADENR